MQTKPYMNLTDVVNSNNFTISFGNFLHLFMASEDKYSMIEDQPVASNEDISKEILCTLAAAAHKLANDYGLLIPDWVHDEKYIMPQPVFAFNTQNKEYQQFLLNDTPQEYAKRNLYTGSNVLKVV